MNRKLLLSGLASLAIAGTAVAQPMGGRWDSPMDQRLRGEDGRRSIEPAKKVEVEAFQAADAAPLLGKGPITVAAADRSEERRVGKECRL